MANRDKHVDNVILLSIGIVILLAYMDTVGFGMWQIIGGLGSEVYGSLEPHYMRVFWGFSYSLIGVIALTYYIIKKDVSESLALFLVPSILVWSGWEDIIYYIIGGHQFWGTTMPWLNGKWFMGTVANLMGSTEVTAKTLMVSGVAGIILAYGVYKWLKNQ